MCINGRNFETKEELPKMKWNEPQEQFNLNVGSNIKDSRIHFVMQALGWH